MNKLKVAVLISGRGSNLKALIDYSKKDDCPYQIVLVLSNKASALGLNFAKESNISIEIISHKDFSRREDFDKKMHEVISNYNAQFVCLAGFMRLLSEWFVNKWQGNIINIHPSLLPSFKGENAQQQAIDYGVKIAGCTVHHVISDMDAGPIIAQSSIEVNQNDDVQSLSDKIIKLEHQIYPKTLEQIAKKYLK